jgi:hypothetical protein
MKFIFTESGYQLFRYRGRSVLLCCVSLLLCGCIAFYLGSLSSNRRALETLGENTPAKVRISNVNADTFDDMTIAYTYGDLLEMLGVGRVVATCQAGGYYSAESQEALNTAHEEMVRQMEERESDWVYVSTYMPEGDVHIYGVTNFEATGLGWAGDVTLGEGYDLSLLEGDEPLCLISDKMSQSTGLEIGDTFTMPVCFLQFTSSFGVGKAFSYMNEYSFTVAGTYPARIETIHPADMYLPLDWLRDRLKEDQPENPFTYSSYTGYLADSMKLNEFKDSLKDCGLGQPFFLPTGEMFVSLVSARTIYMDDEEFIRSAEKLGQSIRQYEMFLVPFFVVVVFLVTMSIFLVLRGCRRDMAIACSLGRPKVVTAAANLMAALSAQLLGALLAVPVSMLLTGVGFGTAMLVCGAFMLCALMGDIVGLIMLLRFDALALLTAAQ